MVKFGAELPRLSHK